MNNNYGTLLHEQDIKLHRKWFEDMAKMLGIKCIYRAPRPDKHYTTYAEIESNYYQPVGCFCIFEEHPTQQTLKKLGWVSELQENASLISVPYDLEGIQQGALFIVPSALDKSKGRLFRVSKLSTIMIYPASITCEIVPEYMDTYEPALNDFKDQSFNIMPQPADPNMIDATTPHEINLDYIKLDY